jgi:hypothetical protein
MIKPSEDHALLDMTVSNIRAIIDIFQDKVITYHWHRYICASPPGGCGKAEHLKKKICGPKVFDFSGQI